MTEPDGETPSQTSRTDDSIDGDDGMKRLLRSALREREEPPHVDVLAGVQKRLRERSGGKFYSDRWATSRQPPIATYLVTSVLMLVIIFGIYLVLAPLRGAAKAIDGVPEPVQIVAPAPAPKR